MKESSLQTICIKTFLSEPIFYILSSKGWRRLFLNRK
jgi:hypothetical protein